MHEIIYKKRLAKDIVLIKINAPEIARNARPGQFVIVIVDEKGERIPLTIADSDASQNSLTLIFQEIGFSTQKLGRLKKNGKIAHILGPLGKPTDIEVYGNVICVGGGVGVAELYPVARALRKAGNFVTGIIGARNKKLLILEKEMHKVCNKLFITTDDGSKGKKGFVTDILRGILEKEKIPQLVYAIGPVVMMKAVSEVTRPYNIKTLVSLNPVLVDATGMCGSCRCNVAGKVVFACVDGPEFDAHQVDFDSLQKRLSLFKEQEQSVVKKNG
jgi:ferredoxin--NADP+ reductase